MISVTERKGISLVSLMARLGRADVLAARMREMPCTSLRVAPSTWWALGADPAELEQALGDLAAVVDQSDAYAILRLTGPRVRDALAKLVFIDLHEEVFRQGDVASTVAAHMGVTLWRLDDGPEGAVFELAAPRSFAKSLWHAVHAGAAEYGMDVRG